MRLIGLDQVQLIELLARRAESDPELATLRRGAMMRRAGPRSCRPMLANACGPRCDQPAADQSRRGE